MLHTIENMLKKFHENDILYSHWKSNEHLEESLCGDTDLDILVHYSQKEKIEKILNESGLKRFRATGYMQYNAVEDFIGFDKGEAKIWHVHLHYKLTLGEKHLKSYTLPWAEYLLNNRVYSDEHGIYTSKPEDELVLLLIRLSLKYRWRDYFVKISSGDMLEMKWLIERVDDKEYSESVNNLLGMDYVSEFKKLLTNDIIYKRKLYSLQKRLRKTLKHFTSYSVSGSYISRSIRELLWLLSGVSKRLGINNSRPQRRVSPSGGTVVAVLGCDGAGKSTTIRYVKKELNKKIDVKHIYLGSGDGQSSIARIPLKIVAKKIGGRGIGASINKSQSKSFKSKAYSLSKIVWATILALEKKKKIKEITKARNNGILVITDRYPQCSVMGYNDGPLLSKYLQSKSITLRKISEWELSIYKSAAINPPELLIKLMVSTETAIKRKPEMTKEEIESKKNAVNLIDFSTNSKVISTDQEIKVSLGETMDEIWKII